MDNQILEGMAAFYGKPVYVCRETQPVRRSDGALCAEVITMIGSSSARSENLGKRIFTSSILKREKVLGDGQYFMTLLHTKNSVYWDLSQ